MSIVITNRVTGTVICTVDADTLEGADLSGRNLSYANLCSAYLYGANLRGALLCNAELRNANFERANLRDANLVRAALQSADLRNADLRDADLRNTSLCNANLMRADLRNADLENADLRNANLSESHGLLLASEWIAANLERTSNGYIAYKTFSEHFKAPSHWVIEPGSMLTEVVSREPTTTCGCGVNVATAHWVTTRTTTNPIWKVLIPWDALPDVIVPYNTDGKLRCGRIVLIESVDREDLKTLR